MNTIKKWTPEKIQQLNEFVIQKFDVNKIGTLMGFSASAIKTKCYELKLSLNYKNKIIKWTPENIARLTELNNNKKTHTEIANEFGCSISATSRILSQLKIRSKNINFFTEDEKNKLIELFNQNYSINYIAKILHRSSPFLCKKALEMGLVSEKSKLIQEQLELKKEGKRRCYNCKKIYPYTDEFFFSNNGECKPCGHVHRIGRYQSLMNNLTVERLIKLRYSQAYQRACKKGWEFNLTPEYLLEIYNTQQGLCFYSGIKMEIALKGYTTNNYVLSIDRKDSSKGYVKDNIVLCCDAVNTMKMQLETSDFLFLCKKIVEHIQ